MSIAAWVLVNFNAVVLKSNVVVLKSGLCRLTPEHPKVSRPPDLPVPIQSNPIQSNPSQDIGDTWRR
jgi:hypothetical protein